MTLTTRANRARVQVGGEERLVALLRAAGERYHSSPIFVGTHRNAPLSPMKRAPGGTIPMHLGSYAPMTPMHLVE
jgi:hypothetical protein